MRGEPGARAGAEPSRDPADVRQLARVLRHAAGGSSQAGHEHQFGLRLLPDRARRPGQRPDALTPGDRPLARVDLRRHQLDVLLDLESGPQASRHFDRRDLPILLAEELYRRDHGSDPPTPEALVGPYLERLPPESRTATRTNRSRCSGSRRNERRRHRPTSSLGPSGGWEMTRPAAFGAASRPSA